MPRLDGTGPLGRGPKTGRGMGNCPRWCGFCPFFGQDSLSKEERLKILKEQRDYLDEEISGLDK